MYMKRIDKWIAALVLCVGLAACNSGQKCQSGKDGQCCKEGQKVECCQKEGKAECCQEKAECCQGKAECCQEKAEGCCQKAESECCKAQEACCPSAAFDQIVASRRSVRSYDGTKTVTKEQVCEVLAAAQEAPSWINYEPTKYYVAMSPDKIAAVKEAVGRNKDRLDGVSALIVSTFEKGKSGFVDGVQRDPIGDIWGGHDCGLSTAFLILKARAMGFDTLIMGGRDEDALRKTFSIPENETVMAVIALGYRKDDPQRPERRPFDEVVKFF